MKNVSNEFKDLSKKIKIQDLKLSINDGELTVQEIQLMPLKIFNTIPIRRLRKRKKVIAKELKYSFDGELFKTIMQQIEISVKNASLIKGKNIVFQYGILVNNEYEYVNMGEYYIKDIEDDKKKEELVVTGYDKMLNFMVAFKQEDLKLLYPCKMKQLVKRICEVCGVEIYSMDFFNADLIVEEDFFTTQELTYRDVLEKIAQATLTTIFIKENKLYLCKIGDSVQTLDTSFLSSLVIGEKFGPVNALVLGRGSVEDNIESIDQQSINSNGRCEIRFDENEFVDNKREQIIDEMLQQIKGLEYYAIESSNLGLLWLEPCDVILAKDRENSVYKSIYLKVSVTITTGIKGEMEASIPETTNTEYKVTTKEEKRALRTERLAKKNEGLIKDIIEEQTETSNKLTEHTQSIDAITDRVSSVETEVEGVNNNLQNNYYTNTETDSLIGQKAGEIEINLNKKVETFSLNLLKNSNFINRTEDKKIADWEYSGTNVSSFITNQADDIDWLRGTILNPNRVPLAYHLKQKTVLDKNIKNYTVSLMCKSGLNSSSLKIGFKIEQYDKNNNLLKTDEERYVFPSGQEKVSMTFETNTNVDYVYTYILLEHDGATGGTFFYIGNAKLEKGSKATDWILNNKDICSVTEMNTKLDLQNENINIELEKKTDKNNLIASINMSTEKEEDGSSMKLKADKISLEGLVTVNGKTKITEDGIIKTIGAILNNVILKGGILKFDLATGQEMTISEAGITMYADGGNTEVTIYCGNGGNASITLVNSHGETSISPEGVVTQKY